ncbi:helix-turn-helix domain-containing protein [Paenibacillus arenilitoris]|uniref:AraC family transcriptional regulator n=1 Tax=Paenibacillus arenilitoris TaxID=2772299 RepID=A0A927CSJ4_9BACL|nr:AraC family transcriptional regulator [Paenibacillus arenilitoris]MBD2870820.1 AraC family transcriptional regulator [Paenibacillus arenilitoris]
MNYEERRPADALAPHIKCVWRLNRAYRANEVGEVLWPDGCQEMIFHYGASYSVQGRPLPRAFFIGMLSRYHHLYAEGEVRLFGVRLLPWGLAALSDKPVRGFNDRFVPLGDALSSRQAALLSELERELEDATDLDAAQRLLESFLLGTLAPDRSDERMIRPLNRLYREPVASDVAIIAKDSGYSQRQFERRCAELTGLAPKKLNKIARFNQARLRLLFDPELDLHECMLEFGYYDYSHFSKDFKQCLGITPVQYKNWVRRSAARFHDSGDVVFLQDER